MNSILALKEISQNISLLYVEDNKLLREVFQSYLQKFFQNIEVCTNGLEALEAYKEKCYDIVVTDINMPFMDGLMMSEKIKEINPYQHIIIISAYKDIANYEKAIKIGIDGYISKPINYEQTNLILYKTALHIKNAKENEEYKLHLEKLVELKTQEMKKHYVTDQLTGLYNRVYLDEQLTSDQNRKTILLLNIDNFSIVNYNFGFVIGDEILQKVVKMLKEFQGDFFTLYRLQGDEFLFLAKGEKLQEAKLLAKKIQDSFAKINITHKHISINISFTIAIDSGFGNDILRTTSLTINEIREIGKNSIAIYSKDSSFEKLQKNNLFWIEKIKECFNGDKIAVYFQAIENIKTKKIDKYEVLARIIDGDNIIMPGQFLKPLAISGMLTFFTKKIIDLAFAYIQDKDVKITINLTGEDFKENYLVDFLQKKAKEYNITPSRVVLEILESVSTISEEVVLKQLIELKRLGYKIAIDDFGTENSNFSRLLTLKVDFIKIDGSFIKNLDTDTNAQEIVKAIVHFAHNIGCKVIAEFVHNEIIYDKIIEFDIDLAQGYYISEPKAKMVF